MEPLVVVPPHRLSQEQAAAIREQWRQAQEGAAEPRHLIVLPHEFRVVSPLSQEVIDADLASWLRLLE